MASTTVNVLFGLACVRAAAAADGSAHGRALRQLGSQKESGPRSGALELQDNLLQLARAAVQNGVTPELEKAVETIGTLVGEDIKPKVLSAHNNAVATVKAAEDRFKQCPSTYAESLAGLDATQKQVDDTAAAHRSCRVSEAPLKQNADACSKEEERILAEKEKLGGELKAVEDSISAKASQCSVTAGESYGDYISREAKDFKTLAEAYDKLVQKVQDETKAHDEKQTSCAPVHANCGAKTEECDEQQDALLLLGCQLKSTADTACQSNQACYNAALSAWNEAKPGLLAQAQDRKTEWTAVSHIECLINVIGQSGEQGRNAIQACLDDTPSTSHLDLALFDVPEPTTCTTKAGPGDESFASSYLAGLPADAPAKEFTGC
jgi:hypothetical protein